MNEAAIDFLTRRIAGLRAIHSELSRLYNCITDSDEADEVRARITSLNTTLFAMDSALNSLKASAQVVPPPSDDEIRELAGALRQLDAYVRDDANVHAGVNYLTQVMSLLNHS